jgi:hypothetical protein
MLRRATRRVPVTPPRRSPDGQNVHAQHFLGSAVATNDASELQANKTPFPQDDRAKDKRFLEECVVCVLAALVVIILGLNERRTGVFWGLVGVATLTLIALISPRFIQRRALSTKRDTNASRTPFVQSPRYPTFDRSPDEG